MTPIAIVDGTLVGKTLYKNPAYRTKTAIRVTKKKEKMLQTQRKGQKKALEKETLSIKERIDKADQIFDEASNSDDDFEDISDEGSEE